MNACASRHFLLQELAAGVYAAVAQEGGAAISNAGLVDLGEDVLVFDAFLTPQAALDLRRCAEELLGRVPRLVINSHYHNDHIWGNQAFVPEAQIIASTRTRELITTEGLQELRWYSANSAQRLQAIQAQYDGADEARRRDLAMWIGYYGGLVEALPALSVCLPGITFGRTLVLHGTRHSAEVMTFEGAHTGSDAIVVLPDAGIVFTSDLLFVRAHPYLGDGKPQQLLAALRAIARLDANVFVPGHGPVGSADDLRRLVEYVEDCQETARGLCAQGAPDDARIVELRVPAAYADWLLPHFYHENIRALCKRPE